MCKKSLLNQSYFSLSVGLKFAIPPSHIKLIYAEMEFECLYDQMKILKPATVEAVSWLKSKLNDLAYQFPQTPITQSCFLTKLHINSLIELKKNKNLLLHPPDKGSGVVLMNHRDYVEKTNAILSDSMKFKLDSHQKDSVLSVKKRLL